MQRAPGPALLPLQPLPQLGVSRGCPCPGAAMAMHPPPPADERHVLEVSRHCSAHSQRPHDACFSRSVFSMSARAPVKLSIFFPPLYSSKVGTAVTCSSRAGQAQPRRACHRGRGLLSEAGCAQPRAPPPPLHEPGDRSHASCGAAAPQKLRWHPLCPPPPPAPRAHALETPPFAPASPSHPRQSCAACHCQCPASERPPPGTAGSAGRRWARSRGLCACFGGGGRARGGCTRDGTAAPPLSCQACCCQCPFPIRFTHAGPGRAGPDPGGGCAGLRRGAASVGALARWLGAPTGSTPHRCVIPNAQLVRVRQPFFDLCHLAV